MWVRHCWCCWWLGHRHAAETFTTARSADGGAGRRRGHCRCCCGRRGRCRGGGATPRPRDGPPRQQCWWEPRPDLLNEHACTENVWRSVNSSALLSCGHRRAPRPSEIAAHLGVEFEEVVEALQAQSAYNTVSLDAPIRPNGGTVADLHGTSTPPWSTPRTAASCERRSASFSGANVRCSSCGSSATGHMPGPPQRAPPPGRKWRAARVDSATATASTAACRPPPPPDRPCRPIVPARRSSLPADRRGAPVRDFRNRSGAHPLCPAPAPGGVA
jgi:hypothetical protein